MKIEQCYELVNGVTKEVLGEEAVINEDLTNIVDIGDQIIGTNNVDNYVKTLVNHIGKVIFVNRVYKGSAPNVLMDGWEFGSILEKISCEMPEAIENESWNLQDGKSYDPNIFKAPKVSAKFYNKRVTFEIDSSITERQVKESFSNSTQLNAFVSMIQTSVQNSLTLKMDGLVERTINNMIAQTMYDLDSTGTYTGKTGNRAVNLLKLYNDHFTKTLTADQAITDPEFIRFASYTMNLYKDRLAKPSTLFNVGGQARVTSGEDLKIVLLSDFKNAAGAYLQSDTFHDNFVSLPNCQTVPFWQGCGTDYGFDSISNVHVSIEGTEGTPVEVNASGVLGIMFDRDSLGVANLDERVRTHFSDKGEFWNYFYKFDAGYFNDLNENFVVFYVA